MTELYVCVDNMNTDFSDAQLTALSMVHELRSNEPTTHKLATRIYGLSQDRLESPFEFDIVLGSQFGQCIITS